MHLLVYVPHEGFAPEADGTAVTISVSARSPSPLVDLSTLDVTVMGRQTGPRSHYEALTEHITREVRATLERFLDVPFSPGGAP